MKDALSTSYFTSIFQMGEDGAMIATVVEASSSLSDLWSREDRIPEGETLATIFHILSLTVVCSFRWPPTNTPSASLFLDPRWWGIESRMSNANELILDFASACQIIMFFVVICCFRKWCRRLSFLWEIRSDHPRNDKPQMDKHMCVLTTRWLSLCTGILNIKCCQRNNG